MSKTSRPTNLCGGLDDLALDTVTGGAYVGPRLSGVGLRTPDGSFEDRVVAAMCKGMVAGGATGAAIGGIFGPRAGLGRSGGAFLGTYAGAAIGIVGGAAVETGRTLYHRYRG